MRESMAASDLFPIKQNLKELAKLYSPESPSLGTVAESSGSIPFQKNILKEWNIVDENSKLPDAIVAGNNRQGVNVLIRFPSSLLADEVREEGTISESTGCLLVDFDRVDWRNFASKVPILLQCHGGAMILGSANDSFLTSDTVRIVQNASTESPPALITISIDYGLAPEDPFPLGVMDALSVIDFFLKDNSSRKSIHVSGISAGANIALVAGFEGCRKFPGRISSIKAQSPFLNPAGDSLSYYMEQNTYPDTMFLRWAWQAYLGLKKPHHLPDDNESELEKILRENSNYSSWKTWKADHPTEGLHRLVNPFYGIPDGLNGDEAENAPTIIVRYNRSDPLCDDAKVIIEALKRKTGKNAFFFEENGIHCSVMGPYDPNNPQEYWKIWADAIFDSQR